MNKFKKILCFIFGCKHKKKNKKAIYILCQRCGKEFDLAKMFTLEQSQQNVALVNHFAVVKRLISQEDKIKYLEAKIEKLSKSLWGKEYE